MSEKCYIDKLDEIVDKYSNKYHRAIQTKPIDIKSGEQIEYSADQNDKYKVGDHIIISQYKNSFAKGYISNCSEKVFIIKEVTNTAPWLYFISDYNREEIIETFYEKEMQKKNQTESRIEKVIKSKRDKLSVKWKGYNNSFNRWIDKRDIV